MGSCCFRLPRPRRTIPGHPPLAVDPQLHPPDSSVACSAIRERCDQHNPHNLSHWKIRVHDWRFRSGQVSNKFSLCQTSIFDGTPRAASFYKDMRLMADVTHCVKATRCYLLLMYCAAPLCVPGPVLCGRLNMCLSHLLPTFCHVRNSSIRWNTCGPTCAVCQDIRR